MTAAGWTRAGAAVVVTALSIALAACGASNTPAATSAAATAAAADTAAPSVAPSPTQAASQTVPITSPAVAASAAPVAAGAVPLDACSLFSMDQASALAGATLTDTLKAGRGGSVCQYKGGHTYVTVTVEQLASSAQADKAFTAEEAQVRAAGGTGTTTSISGIGDHAYESLVNDGSLRLSGIVVVKGPMFMSLVTNTAADDTSLRHCAQTIIDQL